MTTKAAKKKRFNALDVMIVLFVILLIAGAGTRIYLDRRNSDGVEQRTVVFTCIIPEEDEMMIAAGNILYEPSGSELGSVQKIDECVMISETFSDEEVKYVSVTGSMVVKGYKLKNGVFCTMDGTELRINTTLNIKSGENLRFYIDDIVENGQ